MRFPFLAAIVVALSLTACGGKPTANMTPEASTYGQTITPDHRVPVEHQDKETKYVSEEDKNKDKK